MQLNNRIADRIENYVEDGEHHPFFESHWPEQRRLSFIQAAEQFGLSAEVDSIHQRIGYLREIEKIKIPPIVGVIGGKNAGKSSFVSGFLSDAGRRRVLAGEAFKAGTQRFVLWLPQKFKDDDRVRDALDQVFTDTFGNQAEDLPDDPEAAHRAYQQGNSFAQPLVAFDPELDALGFCFLDTPDFQTAYDSRDTEPSAHLRFEWISKSARLLQGVVFIVSRSDIGNQIFSMPESFLATEMQDFPRYLCLNKIRKPQPELIDDADVVRAIESYGAKKTFGSFDFDIRNSEQWLPQTEEALILTDRAAPVFFDLRIKEFGPAIAAESLLTHELRSLDESTLLSTNRDRALSRLLRELESTRKSLLQRIEAHQQHLNNTVGELRDQLETMIPANDQDFIRMTPKLQEHLGTAIREAAPIYVRSLYLTDKYLAKVMTPLKKTLEVLKWSSIKGWFSVDSKRETQTKHVSGLLTPEIFADMSFKCKPTSHLAHEELLGAWADVINHLNVDLSDQAVEMLNQEARALWQRLPFWKKATLSASNLVLVGVLVTPVAGLAVAPAVTLGGAFVAQLSVAELFIGAGFGTLSTEVLGKIIGGETLKDRLDEFSRLQRLQLCCLAHDAFFLPRNNADNEAVRKSALYGQCEPLQPHLELVQPALDGIPLEWSVDPLLETSPETEGAE